MYPFQTQVYHVVLEYGYLSNCDVLAQGSVVSLVRGDCKESTCFEMIICCLYEGVCGFLPTSIVTGCLIATIFDLEAGPSHHQHHHGHLRTTFQLYRLTSPCHPS